MSHGTYSDTLFQLEAFKRIFVVRPNIDFLLRGRSRVLGKKWTNFEIGIFYSFMSLGISACRKTSLGINI